MEHDILTISVVDGIRKKLLEKIGAKRADKMYVDGTDGKIYHIGYVIKGYWLTLYEVRPYRKKDQP